MPRAMASPKAPKLLFVGGSVAPDVRTNCISSLPPSTTQKQKFFFYILIMHNDQIFCVKRVLGPLYVFFTLVRCLEG